MNKIDFVVAYTNTNDEKKTILVAADNACQAKEITQKACGAIKIDSISAV